MYLMQNPNDFPAIYSQPQKPEVKEEYESEHLENNSEENEKIEITKKDLEKWTESPPHKFWTHA